MQPERIRSAPPPKTLSQSGALRERLVAGDGATPSGYATRAMPLSGPRSVVCICALVVSSVSPRSAMADAEAPNGCLRPGQACVDDGVVGVCSEGDIWDPKRQKLVMQLSCGPDYAEIEAQEKRTWIARAVLGAGVFALLGAGAVFWRRRRRR